MHITEHKVVRQFLCVNLEVATNDRGGRSKIQDSSVSGGIVREGTECRIIFVVAVVAQGKHHIREYYIFGWSMPRDYGDTGNSSEVSKVS